MEALPYYKWHWQRWRANRRVQRMSCLQKGIYRELLDECWAEGCIPDDPTQLADIAGCTPQELADSWYALAPCFYEIEHGKLTNKTLEEQRTEMDTVRAARARAGSASAKQKATLAAKDSTRVEHVKSIENTSHIEEERRGEKSREKPSRVKRERKPSNPKYPIFKGLIFDAWKEWANPLEPPWDGAEGKQLGMLLGANPKLGPEGFIRLLQYRSRSEGVNLAERPSRWLRSLTDYAKGPLNQFRQPLNGGNGNGQQNRPSPAQQRRESSNAGIDAAFAGLRASQPARDDASGAGAEAQPGHPRGHGGDVRAGVGGDGEEIRPEHFQGVVIDGVA